MNNINNVKILDTSSSLNSNVPPPIDYIFLERRKKSFRYLIFSIVILTFCLWFSDRYLRFDLDETKYRVALTLEKESARPIMRNIAQKVISNPNLLDDPRYLQYLEFLALIEEDDAVIKLYQDIYNKGNINPSFLINYATKLYFLGEYAKAKGLITEAQSFPPNNSLLGYLESAMIIVPEIVDEKTFEEGISVIVKENRSGNPIIFPEPFWHDTLPKYTYSYYTQRYNILSHCLAPLYRLYSDVLKKIETELNEKNFQNKQIWLEEVFSMGKKISTGIEQNDFYSTLPICIFSLKLQKDTLTLYNKFSKTLHSSLLEKELNKLEQISKLLDKSENLEEKRKIVFEENRIKRIKIIGLVFWEFIELLVIYFFGKLLFYFFSTTPSNLIVVKFPKIVYFFCITWAIFTFLFLFFSLYDNIFIIKNIYIIIYSGALLIIFPFVLCGFPFFSKKTYIACVTIANNKETEVSFELELTKKHPFILFVYSLEKLSGIFLGTYTVLVCILFLTFRIVYNSYPFQLNLIWDLTRFDEYNLIKEFLSLIHS